jgi:hypothetical protein
MMTSRNQHIPALPQATEFQKRSTWWGFSGWGLLALWAVLINVIYPIYLLNSQADYQESWNEAYRFWLISSVGGIMAFGAIFFFWALFYCLKNRCRVEMSIRGVLIILTTTILVGWFCSILLLRSKPVASLPVAFFDLLQMSFLLLLVMANLMILTGAIGRTVEALKRTNV